MSVFVAKRHRIVTVPNLFLVSVFVALIIGLIPTVNRINSQGYYGMPINLNAPRFSLHDANGTAFTPDDLLGRYTFVVFGFINCENVCHNYVGLLELISRNVSGDNAQFVYMAMDVERDTPYELRQYFDSRGENFVSLNARSLATMQSVASRFNAGYRVAKPADSVDYTIEHPSRLYLVDPEGVIRIVYTGAFLEYKEIIKDLNNLSHQQNLTKNGAFNET
ncbi:MAG: SCO family protein [Pseudomonadota bacterium]